MKLFCRTNKLLLIPALILFGCQFVVTAQQTDKSQPVEITADDFPRSRGLTDDLTKGKSVFVFKDKKKPTFRLKRTTPRVKHLSAKPVVTSAKTSTFNLPPDNKSVEVWKQLGVTFWRLGPETKRKPGDPESATITVQESGQLLTAKRVAADTVFNLGDKVRLSFESPAAGYLYIFDREIYADEKVGEPWQTFPTMASRGGSNRVEQGQVIDIPGQPNYFTLKSSDPNWRGELLTVIISPQPLSDVGIPDEPSRTSAAMVTALEDKYLKPASEYEQTATVGQGYTKAEKEAGRGVGTRQLTQDDPFPQTVYRVKARIKEPMLINLNLSLK